MLRRNLLALAFACSLTMVNAQTTINGVPNQIIAPAVPAQKSWIYPSTGNAASGFSVVIPDGITAVAISAPGLLLNGTVTLPVNPTDGQPITINCPKGITALALTANAGQSVSNNFLPSICGVNTPIRVKYYAVNSTWYPN
jgi:hypothetical protein